MTPADTTSDFEDASGAGSLRIAWLGPTPTRGGGATFVGTQLLLELARAGHAVDCFIAGESGDVAQDLLHESGLTFYFVPKRWSWDRWYSRTPLLAFFSGHLARASAQVGVADRIARRHAERPYDLVYQFSQSEYTPLRRRRAALPPIVVHPSTHAAGELRWALRERKLAKRAEPLKRRLIVLAMLAGRALIQRYELPRADRVLAVSRRFAEHLAADYRIHPGRLGVAINPVDLELFQPGRRTPGSGETITLVYVSRISVRKGLDLVAGLSHRLSDLEGRVRIRIFGGPTLWSNYLPLLDDLNPGIARFEGQLPAEQIALLYASSDALLQPSVYEPFGLTAAEGLASGLPVIVSDEVGAADGLNGSVCRVFPSGDLDAFEAEVRQLLADLGNGEGPEIQRLARIEAERHFSPGRVARILAAELRCVVSERNHMTMNGGRVEDGRGSSEEAEVRG